MSTNSESGASAALGCVGVVTFIIYGFVQIWAGYIGIQHHIGTGWAIAALVAVLMFRFSLPITIGSFFGAMNVWGWPWYGALVFAAPGLSFMALMIPGVLASALGKKNQ